MAARYLALTLLAAALGAAQTDRGQASRPLRPCRPANADYARLADETGGQVFQMRGPDLDKAAVVMDSKLSHPETILAATGVLQRGESRQFGVPVDSTVRSVSFSVTVECEPVVVVVRPSGDTILPAGAPGISSTSLSAGRIVTARAPEPGSWLLLVSGRGRYSVQALAQTDLQFNSFDFVRLGGRPGHEGYFPIHGQPVAGEPLTVRARLDGPLASAAFHLLSEAGEPLQSLPLRRDGDEFFGPLEPPGSPFRAAVAGYDQRRFPYQRVLPRLIRIQTVQVSPASTVTELPAGALVNVPFLVRNLGPAATFQVVILDQRGAPSQPVHVHLPSGASALLEAPVETPRRPGASLSVTVTANSTTDPDRVNSATLSLTVVAP